MFNWIFLPEIYYIQTMHILQNLKIALDQFLQHINFLTLKAVLLIKFWGPGLKGAGVAATPILLVKRTQNIEIGQ